MAPGGGHWINKAGAHALRTGFISGASSRSGRASRMSSRRTRYHLAGLVADGSGQPLVLQAFGERQI